MPVSEEMVLDALRSVHDPDLGRDIVSLGFVKNVKICDGNVSFEVELTTPACPVKDILRDECHEAVMALDGVSLANVQMTAQVVKGRETPEDLIPGVKHMVAVASGKGGVGKSTVTCNLAMAFAETGAKVGIVDLDVYGPSIPRMLGCHGEKPMVVDQKLAPIERFGLKIMSLGFLLADDQAAMWRGPIIAGTVKQLLADVDWGDLDYLIADLPPGTGDAPMSAAQLVPLSGVIIVMTPQEVAAKIASKSIVMFRKLDAPVIGVVENMAGFVCPSCGVESRVFPGPGGRVLAEEYNVPFLGSVPLDPAIGEASDFGTPSLIAHPSSRQAAAFREVAGKLAAQVSIHSRAEKGLIRELRV